MRQHERRAPVEPEVRAGWRRWNDVSGPRSAAASATGGGLLLRAGLRVATAGRRALFSRRRRRCQRWRWPDRTGLAGSQIVAIRVAILRFRVADRPIPRIVGRVEAVAPADAVPVGVDNAGCGPHGTGTAPGSVVL